MTQHTPGPWYCSQGGTKWNIIRRKGVGGRIATTWPDTPGGDMDANARLIAAAPEQQATIDRLQAENADLLGALEHSVESLQSAADFVASMIDDKSEKWATYVELTAAMKIADINQLIAKARP